MKDILDRDLCLRRPQPQRRSISSKFNTSQRFVRKSSVKPYFKTIRNTDHYFPNFASMWYIELPHSTVK